jgi:hypothetical protein
MAPSCLDIGFRRHFQAALEAPTMDRVVGTAAQDAAFRLEMRVRLTRYLRSSSITVNVWSWNGPGA